MRSLRGPSSTSSATESPGGTSFAFLRIHRNTIIVTWRIRRQTPPCIANRQIYKCSATTGDLTIPTTFRQITGGTKIIITKPAVAIAREIPLFIDARCQIQEAGDDNDDDDGDCHDKPLFFLYSSHRQDLSPGRSSRNCAPPAPPIALCRLGNLLQNLDHQIPTRCCRVERDFRGLRYT